MKVDRPRARSSAAPTRLNSCDTSPTCALCAGTNAPACASTAISAFWRRKVDLPAMFGPVSSQIAGVSPVVSAQSLATNGSPLRLSARSTTGCRPPVTTKARLSSTRGRVQPSAVARSAKAAARSISAIARAVWPIVGPAATTAATRRA